MAIIDSSLYLYDAQSLIANSGATITSNIVDLGQFVTWDGNSQSIADRGFGTLNVLVGTAVSGSPGGTLSLALQHGNSPSTFTGLADLAPGGSPMDQSLLTAGAIVYSGPIPIACKRFLRLLASVSGTITAGNLHAWLDGVIVE